MHTNALKKLGLAVITCLMTVCLTARSSAAQQTATAHEVNVVPNLVNYSGVLKDAGGKPQTAVTGVTFLLYKDEQGGAPLWMETQNVTPDESGHYTAQLGANTATGLPADLFQTGEARWLAVQMAGEAEQSRVLLVAVPYAMKAADAATIGGLPPSAFVMAPTPTSSSSGTPASTQATTAPQLAATKQQTSSAATKRPSGNIPVTTAGGTASYLPLWDTASDITNSAVFEVPTVKGGGALIGINTTTPVPRST